MNRHQSLKVRIMKVYTMRPHIAIFLGGLMILIRPATGYSWGDEGHEIVGLIAEHYLNPAVRACVSRGCSTKPCNERRRRDAGGGIQPPPISPAVTLIANPRIDALNKNDTRVCTITTLRTSRLVVDTSEVWQAAAMVKEK